VESGPQLDRISIVLVRARNPSNIGAVARAMHDFGFRRLRVVNDYAVPFETARSAVDASAILTEAKTFSTVAEAVADCTLVVGTTAVGERTLQHPLHALPEAAPAIYAELTREDGRVALLFGSEKTGLSNDELSHCHWLLTIPMQQHEDLRHPSMNLGQAVAVCLYELVRQTGVHAGTGVPEPARADDIERFTILLNEVLEKTGYTHRHPSNCD
jgi:tRNA/rRNA methyltransferase